MISRLEGGGAIRGVLSSEAHEARASGPALNGAPPKMGLLVLKIVFFLNTKKIFWLSRVGPPGLN